jgi:hypothetical protein
MSQVALAWLMRAQAIKQAEARKAKFGQKVAKLMVSERDEVRSAR